jgi:hypothetical protein
MATKQDKNFTVRLKASVDRAATESGLLKMAINGSKHAEDYQHTFDRFIELLEGITVQYLQGELPVRSLNLTPR